MNLHDEELNIGIADFADPHHLNVIGARKCANFLGEYLLLNYDMTDHRGDPAYESWDRFAANRENLYLRAITDNTDYFEELKRDNKSVLVIPYRLFKDESEPYLSLQENLRPVSHSIWDEEDILYGEENGGAFVFGEDMILFYGKEEAQYLIHGADPIGITKNYDKCELRINDETVIDVSQPGLLLVVYDNVNDEIADVAEFVRDNGYAIKHLYTP